MNSSLRLLRELVRTAPFQPATNYWRAVELDAVLRHGFPQGRGLDLGCGDGKLTRVVLDFLPESQRRDIRLVGVDVDPLETSQAEATGLYDTVHTGSAASIPEPSGSFDFVFSNSVLEHIGPIDEVLAEAARLLKPGGSFLFTVPGPDFHRCLAGRRMRGGATIDYLRMIDERCAHLRYWSLDEWAEHLGRCGLKVRLSSEYLSLEQTRRWEFLSGMTAGALYMLYGQRKRPIEIQRSLRMRSSRTSALGRLLGLGSPLLTLGRSARADVAAERFGCLLIEAVK
jgi:SAM-dependent methyltransferase